MKTLLDSLKVSFLIIGSVIGAGFITGRELIGFFGKSDLLISTVFASLLFLGSVLLIFSFGKKFGSLKETNEVLFKNQKPFNVSVLVCSFISVVSMLAGLDALGENLGLNGLPIISTIGIIVVALVSTKGIRGIENISLFLVPALLILIAFLLFRKGEFVFDNNGVGVFGTTMLNSVLYVSMNTFFSLPIMLTTAKKRSKTSLIISACICSAVIGVFMYLILGAIYYEGKTAINASMPLFTALRAKDNILFAFMVFVAIITSLFTAFYPLYNHAYSKKKAFGTAVLCLSALIVSRLGLKFIVSYMYPVTGAIGTAYLIKCIIFKIKELKIDINEKRKFRKNRKTS